MNKVTAVNVSSHPLFDANDISIAINDILLNCSANAYVFLESGSWKSRTIKIMNNKSFTLDLKGKVELVIDTTLFKIKNNLQFNLNVDYTNTHVVGSTCLEIYESYHGIYNIKQYQFFDIGVALVPNKITSGYNEGIQYCKFYFERIHANVGAILFQCGTSSLPWINENTFIGGRILGGYGIKFIKGAAQLDPYNNNKFYNIGCEGLSDNAIDLQFSYNNTFENLRIEQVKGLEIKEAEDCKFNIFRFSMPIHDKKLDLKGRESVCDFPILSDTGVHIAYKRLTNTYADGKDFNLSLYNNVPNLYGIAHGEYAKPLFNRYMAILRNGTETINIPCREVTTTYIDNINFKMVYMYRDMRILSNKSTVTIIIPNKFKYDGAEFHFSTNWNTNPIIFLDENGVEQFRISKSDGIGTWHVMYIERRGSFSEFKLTTDYRAF
ncbi:hypothetical protein CN563_10365 [Bacillus sp. AFS026049]|uniref:hypothetical protein n=1 Tax=Peribacillus frigoritolerans TaxID=450367 RepID=UPI000BF4B914|nr:hypothetical protein CN563_10365 [Bacillus sp. AFS026049]